MRRTRSSRKIDSKEEETSKKKTESETEKTKDESTNKRYNVHQKRILEKLRQKKITSEEKNENVKRAIVKFEIKVAANKLKNENVLKNNRNFPLNKAKPNKSKIEKSIEDDEELPDTNKSSLNDSSKIKAHSKLPKKLVSDKQNKRNSMEKRLKNLRNSISKRMLDQNENPTRKKDFLTYSTVSNNLEKTPQNILKFQKNTVNSNSEVRKTNNEKNNEENVCSMDWEEMDENCLNTQHMITSQNDNNAMKFVDKFVVVDTNILLSHLRTIQNTINDSIKIDHFSLKFVIPWRVLCELDGLKENNNSSSVSTSSRIALKYLHENLAKSSNIIGQSLKDANDHVFECPTPDDEILNCCLQLALKNKNVALLSNDISLCNKVITNNIQTYTHEEFVKKLFQSKTSLITGTKQSANIDKNTQIAEDQLKKINSSLRTLLSTILEEEMKSHYDELWLKIVLLQPPWSLMDAIKCIKKHWMAVFSESFPKSFIDLLSRLQIYFTPPKSVRKGSDENLKEINTLVSEICNICIKLPEYRKISKTCLDEIETIMKLDTKNLQIDEFIHEDVQFSQHAPVLKNKGQILNCCEVITNGFNAFCSQLANLVEVQHDIKTTEMNIPIPTLLAHANDVSAQLSRFINVLHRTLTVFAANSTATETEINDVLINLKENIISTSHGMGHQIDCNDKDVASFCILERSLIEKMFVHFTSLYELLLKCSEKCSNK